MERVVFSKLQYDFRGRYTIGNAIDNIIRIMGNRKKKVYTLVVALGIHFNYSSHNEN